MIVYRPVKASGKGGNIPNDVIDTATTRHPDGFGIAWRADGALHVEKFGPGPENRTAFRALLKDVDKMRGVEYVSHFRFATHGPKDAAHAHPYEYVDAEEGRVLVFHNGIIDIATTKQESDTEVFVRDVLAALPARWWTNPALKYLVHEAIGWSKLVLMTDTETISLQDARGEWDGGLWYSSDHKPYKWAKYSGTAVGTLKEVSSGKGTSLYAEPIGGVHLEPTGQRGYHTRVLRHGGHDLWVVDNEASIELRVDGDYGDSVLCCVCYTSGDVYIIDGHVNIEMAHKMGTSLIGDADPDEDEQAAEALFREEHGLLVPVNRALVPVN